MHNLYISHRKNKSHVETYHILYIIFRIRKWSIFREEKMVKGKNGKILIFSSHFSFLLFHISTHKVKRKKEKLKIRSAS